MQSTSKAYKTEQAGQLRNESYVWVYLGVINRDAQRNASVSGDFTFFSKESEIFNNQNVEAYYATYEQDQCLADGSMYFLPRTESAVALYQGLVTEDFLDPITITFGNYQSLDIKGLTIDFGQYYPTEFTISNGTYTYTYTHDKPDEVWTTEDDEWLDTSYLTITPISMVGGNQRLRIMSMLMGVGFMFDNNSLISTSRKNTVSHVSDTLPSKSFDFTVSNYNKKFSADDPHSFVAFLQTQQEVEYDYGRLLDDGTIFRIPGGKTALKSWSSNSSQAKFSSVGMLDFQDGTYYGGQYSTDGTTLYDLAVAVCEDAGFEDYQIDTYLKSITTHNPLPVAKHKELLQLIANAAQSIMYEDRKGRVTIQSSFVPDITSIVSNGAEAYSDMSDLLNESVSTVSYATYEQDFTKASSTQYFAPRTTDYLDCGYVSSEVSDEDGLFTTNPVITITYEAKWNFFNISLVFQEVTPTAFTVRGYGDGDLVCEYLVTDIDYTTVVNEEFLNVDTVEIEFTEAEPYQRVHISKYRTGSKTDYELENLDLAAKPTATTAEFVKNVNVHYYELAEGEDSKVLSTIDALAGSNETVFSTPCTNYSLRYKNSESGTLTIVESGAYYIQFTSTISAEVEIVGSEYIISDSIVTSAVRETGNDKTSKNPLIDNLDWATENAVWLNEHYANDLEYIVYYRGEPALDCDDQIYLESDYVIKNLVRITSEQLDTAQGMSLRCRLNARRISYKEVARVNYAIVNVSEVVGS